MTWRIKHANHDLMMKTEDKDTWELDKKTFIKVTNKFKLKNKNMYKHFIKSGDQYKNAIFVYMKKLIKYSHRLCKHNSSPNLEMKRFCFGSQKYEIHSSNTLPL